MTNLTKQQIADCESYFGKRVKKQPQPPIVRKQKLQNYINRSKAGVVKTLGMFSNFVTIDIENYERNQKRMTEIGMSIFTKNSPVITRHLIIEENINKLNGRFVANNKFEFNYGTSEIVPLDVAAAIVKNEIDGGCIVVGHGMQLDLRGLKTLGVEEPKAIIDTQQLYNIVAECRTCIGLENLLIKYNLNPHTLHNGGNDAHFTSLVFKNLISDLRL